MNPTIAIICFAVVCLALRVWYMTRKIAELEHRFNELLHDLTRPVSEIGSVVTVTRDESFLKHEHRL